MWLQQHMGVTAKWCCGSDATSRWQCACVWCSACVCACPRCSCEKKCARCDFGLGVCSADHVCPKRSKRSSRLFGCVSFADINLPGSRDANQLTSFKRRQTEKLPQLSLSLSHPLSLMVPRGSGRRTPSRDYTLSHHTTVQLVHLRKNHAVVWRCGS